MNDSPDTSEALEPIDPHELERERLTPIDLPDQDDPTFKLYLPLVPILSERPDLLVFTRTPGGIYAGGSFSDAAIWPSRERLDDFVHEAPKWLDQPEPLQRTVAEIELNASTPLSMDQYRILEADLLEILVHPWGSISDRLIAQSAYLGMMSKFLNEVRSTAKAEYQGDIALNERGIAKFRAGMRGDGPYWQRLHHIAQKRPATGRLRRSLIAYVLEMTRANSGALAGLKSSFTASIGFLAQSTGRGKIRLQGFDRDWTVEELSAVVWPDDESVDLWRRIAAYIDHSILRKDLCVDFDVLFNHHLLLLRYALIQWTSAAHALEDDRRSIEAEDVEHAIGIVESHYGLHKNWNEQFRRTPRLKALMDSMFSRPLFPFAMARG